MRLADAVPGERAGKLIIERVYLFEYSDKRGRVRQRHIVDCTCDCGNKVTYGVSLLKKRRNSCGCGYVRHNLTRVSDDNPHGRRWWDAARHAYRRCNLPSVEKYADYGGRGIEFRFSSVAECARYIGTLPGSDDPQLSLDRIDVENGHYAVGHLRWATAKEQRANQRRTLRRIEKAA